MAPYEKSTYFGYREGHDPSLLQLGSLVFDYANPLHKRPFFARGKPFDNVGPPMVSSDSRKDCYMMSEGGENASFGIGVLDYAQLDLLRQNSRYLMVAAKTGSKIFLIDTLKYLENVVLKSEEAQIWLSTRLAVSRRQKLLKDLTFNHPKLWMLTGLYLMDDATTVHVSSRDGSVGATASAPIPDPLMISELLQAGVGAKVEFGVNYVLSSGSTIEGKRVWAAQWQQIKADYVVTSDDSSKPLQVNLTDKLSIRKARGEKNVAALNVSESKMEEQKDDSDETYDQNYWNEFDKELDELLEDMDSEDED